MSLLDIETDVPVFAVETAVVHEGKVLLIRWANVRGWAFPGGYVKPNESVLQAAVRETLEMTGVEVELVRLLGVYSRPNWRKAGHHQVSFVARPVSGEPKLSPLIIDVGYFSPEQLPTALFPFYHQRVEDALAPDPSPVVRVQNYAWPSEDELRELDPYLDDLEANRIVGPFRRWWDRWTHEVETGTETLGEK